MKYITEMNKAARSAAIDDTILVKDALCTSGSKMLYNFTPLFDAEAVVRLKNAGYAISGKANVGEFGLDVIGETSFYAPEEKNGALRGGAAAIVADGDAEIALCTDLDGAPRRAAACEDIVFIKPTYGTVSRYGIAACACSAEQIGVMAKTAAKAAEALAVIAGHDGKDGTSLPEKSYEYKLTGTVSGVKAGVCKSYFNGVSDDVSAKFAEFTAKLASLGADTESFEDEDMLLSQPAWKILLSGETCNNVSRYDGVKYGYRTENYKNIDELYTNSRTEGMGLLAKSVILYGSDVLQKGRYDSCYDKSLRIRRVLREKADQLFKMYDVIVMPAASKLAFTKAELGDSIDAVYAESKFTSFASLLGLPAIVVGGVQLVADSMNDSLLLSIADAFERGL